MSREIKFRVYSEGLMSRACHLRDWHSGWAYGEGEGHVMQYTGMKDRHGVEVYEGDVMRCKCRSEGYYLYLIKWMEVAGSDDMGIDMVGYADVFGDIVIGNIYENPELLKEVEDV